MNKKLKTLLVKCVLGELDPRVNAIALLPLCLHVQRELGVSV